MKNSRWWVLLGVVGVVLVALLAMLASDPVRPPPLVLSFPDAGAPQLAPASSTWSARGVPFPTAVVGPRALGACVRGEVVDAVSGRGLANAPVTFETFAGVVSATTDAAGAFELEGLREGDVKLVEVSALGYQPFRPEWGRSPLQLNLREGVCITSLRLTLAPWRDLEGLVVAPAGQPVEGAAVTAATPEEPGTAPVFTDDAGRFRLPFREGALIEARHARWGRAQARVDFRVEASGLLRLTLEPWPDGGAPPAVVVRGLVVDALDAGVPLAWVKVTRAVTPAFGEPEVRAEALLETDEAGRFSTQVEGPGPWTLQARGQGTLSEPESTDGAPVTLRLREGAVLEGRVRDGQGAPVRVFSVLVSRRLGALQRAALEPTHVVDAEGHFRLHALPPGPAEVVVVAPGLSLSEPVAVELAASQPRRVEVVLERGAEVSGRVVDRESGAPIEGARVSLERAAADPLLSGVVARTGADGRFRLEGLPSGRHSLFVAAVTHDARLLTVELDARAPTPELRIDLAPVPDGGTPELELVGIGAVLEAVGDGLVVKQVVAGGGAAEVGLGAGDVVLSIDGEATARLGFSGSIERIRGEQDSVTTLEVRRAAGAVERLVVPRRRISH